MEKTTHYEKTLSSEVLFEGRVITLTKDTALLENGKTATREVVHHHGGACILPYFEDGTICMVRQFRYAMQQELWELPAGKLEKGEDPFEAAKRELGEECGLTADNYISLGQFFPTVGYDTEVIYTWVATGLHKTQMHLDAIFYPCLTYNIDEGLGDNHYNCPVVAYYPEVLAGNCPELEGQKFIYDYVGIHRPKDFVHKMAKEILPKYFGGISEKEVQEAANAAYAEYESHMAKIRVKGSEIIDEARRQGKRIIVLAGRPYHVDPEVNHGIARLITRHGAAVVTEDSISNRVQKFPTSVLNQWTYHSRLYAAAKYCTTQNDMDLVQLVSFGCGVDAITTDETREILQRGNKLYTQLKIDEITNLGAVNIRLRSLFAALDERDEAAAEKAE